MGKCGSVRRLIVVGVGVLKNSMDIENAQSRFRSGNGEVHDQENSVDIEKAQFRFRSGKGEVHEQKTQWTLQKLNSDS